MKHYFPESYAPVLDIKRTQEAILHLKEIFPAHLRTALNLTRVSAPLFVDAASGLNDDLNGVERPVGFDLRNLDNMEAQVVQSLAKWKRYALGRYGYGPGTGLYTDMNAIRRDEETDNLHSYYVDQWDWEKTITDEDRTIEYLKTTVQSIHDAIKATELELSFRYPELKPSLPSSVTFLTTQEAEDRYPELTPQEREIRLTEEYGAVFLMQIGGLLRSGIRHDGRAPDYDDWQLNGDLLYTFPVLGRSVEISSMGIRVNKESLLRQLEAAGQMSRMSLPFHKALLEDRLPLSIGGGIGQSRLCMLLLQKAHIGEVQCSIWPEEAYSEASRHGVTLL